MPLSEDLLSAAIAVVTGLAVALIVQVMGVLSSRRQRKASIRRIRDTIQEFENELRSLGTLVDDRITGEQAQFAFWQAHLETLRVTVSAHSPFLRQEDFLNIMTVIDGKARVTRMIADSKRVPGIEFYEQYFEAIRGLDCLKLKGSKSR